MNHWNNLPREPRCQRVVTNTPTGCSTLGFSEVLLYYSLTVLSLAPLDKKIEKVFSPGSSKEYSREEQISCSMKNQQLQLHLMKVYSPNISKNLMYFLQKAEGKKFFSWKTLIKKQNMFAIMHKC